MKKSALLSILFLMLTCVGFAQIRPRTTKPVTTQEITKTNRLSTTTSTGSATQPITSTQPDSFFAPYYNNSNYAKRLSEINPSSQTFAFHAVDYNGDGIKDIAYKDFYLNDLLGWFFPDLMEFRSSIDPHTIGLNIPLSACWAS